MNVLKSYEYIKLGLLIRMLRHISQTYSAEVVINALRDLRAMLESANFSVSLAYFQSKTFGEMLTQVGSIEPRNGLVGPAVAASVSSEMGVLENVIFAEASTKSIYLLPERRFNSDFLLSNPSRLLKAGVFEKLDEVAQSDISSACRCILFGEATAAAFHILRATESVLVSYYHHHRRQNRLAKPMWGPMVDQLKIKTRNKPPAPLLAALDLIRTAYRNPTQHPQAVYQIDSAQDLFGVCIDAIGKMADEL